MERYREVPKIDFDRYPKTNMYFPKRVSAYVVDNLITFVVLFLIMLLGRAELPVLGAIILLYILTGIVTYLWKSLVESLSPATPGKMFFSLMVVGPNEKIDIRSSFVRNVSCILPLLGPGIDMIMARGKVEDDRQRYLDATADTLVVEDIEVPLVRPTPVRRVAPKEPDRTYLDYRSIRVGNCQRCGAPYRVLAPDDDSFSGLWNHRCTWCNNLIRLEDL